MKALTQHIDGVNAIDLGIIGGYQYAVSTCTTDVWRRPADQVNTYGGWRWECESTHPGRYSTVPGMAELATRLEKLF